MAGNVDESLGRLKRLFFRLSILDNRHEERKGKTMTQSSFRDKFNGKMLANSERELTFIQNNWSSVVSTSEMSSAGFCCMGKNGPVVCFQCKGVIVDSWKEGDIPSKLHRKMFPKCNFAKTLAKQTKVSGGGLFSQRGIVFDAVCTTENVAGDMNSEDSTQEIPSIQDYFRVEYNRLLTLQNWPEGSPVDRSSLAAAGLYRLGDSSDIVKCFACSTEVGGWRGGDVPMVRHLSRSPDCPFVNQRETDNRRITEHEKQQADAFFRRSRPQYPTDQVSELPSTGIVESSSEESSSPVKYKKFRKEEDRMRTFASWPENHCQRPEALARAGFFSLGAGDRVACFSCGGQLLDWELEDDPFEEHTMHYPDCRWAEMERCKNRIIEMKEQLRADDDVAETSDGEPQQTTPPADDEIQDRIEYEPDEDGSGKKTLSSRGGETEEDPQKQYRTPSKRAEKCISNTTEEESQVTNTIRTKDRAIRTSKTKEELFEEMEIIRDRNLCKICMDQDVETLFLPCKHLCVCESCADKVELCPICREYIDEKIFVFVT